MSLRDRTGCPGRPRRSLIEDPYAERDRGERLLRRKMREYAGKVSMFGPRGCTKPMEPICELDRGLVYARYAGLVSPQAVPHILKRTREFETWMFTQRAARGPAPDIEQAVQLYLARETIASIRQKQMKETPSDVASRAIKESLRALPAVREIQEALALLFDETPTARAVKARMQRFRPRLAEFEASRSANRKQRPKVRRRTADAVSSEDAGRACRGSSAV